MKPSILLTALVSCLLVATMAGIANAGVVDGGELPEPTALLVWLGLVGAGGLFFWRRNRDDVYRVSVVSASDAARGGFWSRCRSAE
jgi:hypothetical protein